MLARYARMADPPHRPGDDLLRPARCAYLAATFLTSASWPSDSMADRSPGEPARPPFPRSAILAADGAGFRGPTGFAQRCRARFSPLPGDWRAYWLFADVSAQTWRMSVKPAPVWWLDLGAGGGGQQLADRFHQQSHLIGNLPGIAVN